METKVVHVRKTPFDVYIGRPYAEFIEGSALANPFHQVKGKTRDDVVIEYALHFFGPGTKWMRELAMSERYKGKTLGCWCAPLWCHGDIIAGYIEWKKKLDNGEGL